MTPQNGGTVVAVVLTHEGRLCLLRRSDAVDFDRGRWHCVTGYLPHGIHPARQAMAEVQEETGLRMEDPCSLTPGRPLRLFDTVGRAWTVHTFHCEVSDPELRINWEHDAYTWVSSIAEAGRDVVPWLRDVVDSVS